MRTDEKALEERLRSLAHVDDPVVVRQALEGIRAEDLAEGFQRIDVDESLHVLQRLDEETAADILVELPTENARRLINELPDATVAHYLDILPMDDALELREELDPERFEALLHVIPREDALEIRRLLSYPEESAGQLMTEDFLAVGPDDSMLDVLERIRTTPEEEYETVNTIFVLDEHRHLLGLLSLKHVLRTPPMELVRTVMKEDVITVRTDTPEEEAARTLAHYGFAAVPVLDDRGRMVGILTADDAQEILEEAETEDVLALGAVTGDAEPYLSLGTLSLVKRRLPWLLVLFVAEFLTGFVLRRYTSLAEEGGRTTLAQLMLFVPLLIGAGGNAGSQVTTTIIRALALGEVGTRDAVLIWRREMVVALAIGATLGTVGFGRALMWGSDWRVSTVVGLSLPAIILWATFVASALPLVAKRLNLDPAVMSAPFIATFVDATGMIIFFEIARRITPF
ncbi:MAG TPA: magnesium transporter [Fimbriimonas sp.]